MILVNLAQRPAHAYRMDCACVGCELQRELLDHLVHGDPAPIIIGVDLGTVGGDRSAIYDLREGD